MDEIVKCKIKSFSYGRVAVLEDIDLTINRGQCMVITGMSGCGKTTLLRLINGLIPSLYEGELDGQIEILGKKTTDYDPGELAFHVGNVFQNPNDQFFSTNVEDEIALVGENLGMEREILKDRVQEAMDLLDIRDLADKTVYDLSGGQKQKVAIASTLVYDTDLIVLDEPSSSLDYRSIEDLKIILRKLKSLGKTLIIADHRLYYLMDILDDLVIMDKGRIVASYKKSQLNTDIQDRHKLRVFHEESLQALRSSYLGNSSIKIEDLQIENKGFRHKKPISFDIGQGECMGLIGPNGVGKSTLAKQLVGLLDIKKGEVNFGSTNNERLINTSISLQQSSNMFFKETVERELIDKENLGNQEYLDLVKYYLKTVELWEVRSYRPQELSGGQKQRLSLIISVLKDAKLLILDEPTSGLDKRRMDLVSEVIIERSQDIPTILISHDLELVFKTCNTVLLLGEDSYHKLDLAGNEKIVLDFVKQK